MGKSKHKISNWKQYNQALVQRGSLTVWMDEQAIQQWHCQTHHGRRGRGFHYSDSAIETALMLKAVFKLPLRALEGFINSLFKLMKVPLQSPDYSCISKRAKTVEIKYRLPSHGPVAHLVIDATGLKVYGEGEWKIRKLDTLVLYLQQIGVSRLEVDASSFMLALRQRGLVTYVETLYNIN